MADWLDEMVYGDEPWMRPDPNPFPRFLLFWWWL